MKPQKVGEIYLQEKRHGVTSKVETVTDKDRNGVFPGGPVVKSPPDNAEDTGSIPAKGRPHMLWGN